MCVWRLYPGISVVLFLDTCFIAQHMDFLGEYFIGTGKECVYSAVIVHIVLELSVGWNWLVVLLNYFMYLLILCLIVLSVTERALLISAMKILNLFYFLILPISVSLILKLFTCILPSWWIGYFIIMKYFCLSHYISCLEVYFVWY